MTIRVPECAFENMNFDWSESWLAGTDKAGKMAGDDQNPCTGIKDGSGKLTTRTVAPKSEGYKPGHPLHFHHLNETIFILNHF